MTLSLANPVAGRIAAKGEPHPAGTFAVTSTFADHVASGRAPGIDFGNAACGAPILAAAAGVVSLIVPGVVGATTSDKASIIRVRHADGSETGYAHHKIRAGIGVGQAVPVGYQLGTVDKIGAVACHLHFGLKINGVEVDAWPYLAQNQEEPVVTVTAQAFSVPAIRWTTPAAGEYEAYKLDGTRKAANLGANTGADADYVASIARTDGKQPSGGGWLHVTTGVFEDHFLQSTTVTVPVPLPTWQVEAEKQKQRANENLASANKQRERAQGIKDKVALLALDVADD